jgi:uncharacterized protein (TIGR02757 family)
MPLSQQIVDLLNQKVEEYNQPEFIPNDPISIPHLFSKKQDIEIMGFWAATLAWGQRTTIIKKSKELIDLFDNQPFDFIQNHKPKDLERLQNFKHRTFNNTDTLYFIEAFKRIYQNHGSIEELFASKPSIKLGIDAFRTEFFNDEFAPKRTGKHIASPAKNASCKRINMFLRWMVRHDDKGVDFGIWKKISPSDLIMPIDVHVERISKQLGLLQDQKVNWQTAEYLTETLKELDPQ